MEKIAKNKVGKELVDTLYNTILRGQYWYGIGVLPDMCNTGDYAMLSNTKIFVCNTKENLMKYRQISLQ